MRAFRIAYDGRPFHGFQRQPDVPTVEDAILDALRALAVCEDVPEGYAAAGRTDAGVSAICQTVAFDCPDWLLPRALNGELPPSIHAWATADVAPDFHATHDARRRVYTYYLYAPDADDSRARQGARRLSGEHDFHNLTADDRNTVRDLSLDVTRDGDYLVVTTAAGGFPRGLVRRLVSLLRSIAAGDQRLERIDRILSPDPIDGPDGIPRAPAYPLVLSAVDYDVAFEPDARAVEATGEYFEDRRMELETRKRVAAAIGDGIGAPNPRSETDSS